MVVKKNTLTRRIKVTIDIFSKEFIIIAEERVQNVHFIALALNLYDLISMCYNGKISKNMAKLPPFCGTNHVFQYNLDLALCISIMIQTWNYTDVIL